MKRIKGHILHEAIIAMGIITIGVLGMVGFLSRAIGEGRYIADQTTAVKLAGEGIEITRNILDGNTVQDPGNIIAWNAGLNTPGFFEVDYTSQTLGNSLGNTEDRNVLRTLKRKQVGDVEFYSYLGTEETSFKRSVQIISISDHQISATSRVYWTARGGRLDSVSITSDFYNWR